MQVGRAIRTATSFYGTRYVISSLDQRTLGLDTRLNVTFSPTMTLELYMQPFFAAGKYYDFKEYVGAAVARDAASYGRDRGTIDGDARHDGHESRRTRSIRTVPGPRQPFTIDNPDFSAAVAARERGVSLGVPAGIGAVRRVDAVAARLTRRSAISHSTAIATALFAARPDNIFLVKASWWLTR